MREKYMPNDGKSTQLKTHNESRLLAQKQGVGVAKLDKKWRIVLSVIASLFVGVANGLFGGGGGMLVIPIFTLLLGLEEKLAHSSAILTILPLSLVSGIIYITQGNFTVPNGLWVGGGVIAGGLIGTFVMKKLSNNALQIIFYTLMIVAGISTLIKNFN